jgi:hypothetical protein
MSERRHAAAAPTLAFSLVLALTACKPAGPTPTPQPSPSPSPAGSPSVAPTASGDPLAIYREIEDQVIAIRGLQPRKAIEPQVIDVPTLVANLTAEFDRANRPEDVAAEEALDMALGLLEPGRSLREAFLDLQGEQVLGYYSSEADTLFVVSRSGGIGPTEKVTFAHEFTHALQDQHFDLGSLDMDDLSNSDRSLARLALVEGDATAAQFEWIVKHLTDPDELAQLLAEASDPEILASLNRAPPILRETSLFPYTDGLSFVQALQQEGGFEAVNRAYAEPPEATAEIIHPADYPRQPTELDDLSGFAANAGDGWSERREDTLGEVLLKLFLTERGVRETAGTDAAAGWTSDRVALFESGDQHVVLLVTDWASPSDADEFEAAGRTAIAGQDVSTVIRVSTDRVVLIFGTDRDALDGIADQVRTGGCC